MFTHLTLMPVSLVKAARAAFGGASAASATVMVTPLVLVEPPELLLLHAAVAATSPATPATRAPRANQYGIRCVVLGMSASFEVRPRPLPVCQSRSFAHL